MQTQITKASDKLTRKYVLNRISDVPGGVSLILANLIVGNVVLEASPLTAPVDGKRTICKQAVILAGSTTTVFQVETDSNHFKVGEFLGRKTGGLAYAITTIVDNGDGSTAITVGTALEDATVGGFIYEMDAESATTTSALENTPEVILKAAFQVPTTTQVIYMKDAYVRADVTEQAIGSEYLATLDVNVIKY